MIITQSQFKRVYIPNKDRKKKQLGIPIIKYRII